MIADSLAQRALALAATVRPGDDVSPVVAQLSDGTDQASLNQARQYLVWRVQQRSDDFEAGAALGLVNRALAHVGWRDPYSWKHRRKP